MDKLFTTKNQVILLFVLVLMTTLSTCNSCNSKSEVNRLKKETIKLQEEIDTLYQQTATVNSIEKMLKIEGLKSEKRMIQSTDRKIFDVNRQSEIDKEIDALLKAN
jgi:hypothetical protein